MHQKLAAPIICIMSDCTVLWKQSCHIVCSCEERGKNIWKLFFIGIPCIILPSHVEIFNSPGHCVIVWHIVEGHSKKLMSKMSQVSHHLVNLPLPLNLFYWRFQCGCTTLQDSSRGSTHCGRLTLAGTQQLWSKVTTCLPLPQSSWLSSPKMSPLSCLQSTHQKSMRSSQVLPIYRGEYYIRKNLPS